MIAHAYWCDVNCIVLPVGLCLAFPSKLGHGACGSGEPMEVGERGALQDKDSNFALMNHTCELSML